MGDNDSYEDILQMLNSGGNPTPPVNDEGLIAVQRWATPGIRTAEFGYRSLEEGYRFFDEDADPD